MPVGTGHLSLVAFGSIGGSHPIRSIQIHDASGAPVDISHLQTTKPSRVYLPHDLYDIGGASMDYLFDSADQGPTLGVFDNSVRITLPARVGETDGGYWEGPAYVSQINGGNLDTNQEQVGQMTLQWLQLPTYTLGS